MRTDRPIPLRLDPDRLQRDAVNSLTRAAIAVGRAALDRNVKALDVAKQWDDRGVELVLRAAVSPTSTSNSPAATQVAVAFLGALTQASAGADLLARGIQLNFSGASSISVPNVSVPNADFVAEGMAFPVRTTPTSPGPTLTAHKLGTIVVLTGEMLRSSNAETLVRQALIESVGPSLDKVLFSANAADATHPAGLLNGIAGLSPGGAGVKAEVLVDDVQKLATAIAPVAGNSGIVLVASPDAAVALTLRPTSELTWPVLMSASLAPKTVIAVAGAVVASAIDGAPQVDARQETAIHMADPASPAIDGATPVGSTFQSDSVALRLRWPISWALRDTRGVAWMTGVNW